MELLEPLVHGDEQQPVHDAELPPIDCAEQQYVHDVEQLTIHGGEQQHVHGAAQLPIHCAEQQHVQGVEQSPIHGVEQQLQLVQGAGQLAIVPLPEDFGESLKHLNIPDVLHGGQVGEDPGPPSQGEKERPVV